MEDRNVPEGTQERPRCPCPHPPRIPRGAELSSCCGPRPPASKAQKSQPCPPAPHPILRTRARSPLVVNGRHCSGLYRAGSALWGS